MNNITENRVEGTIRLCTFTEKKLQVEKNISESTFSELRKLLKNLQYSGEMLRKKEVGVLLQKSTVAF